MPKHPKTISYGSWKGINNISSPQTTDAPYLKDAVNIDIDKLGNLQKRKGYTKVASGNTTSLWASSSGLGCFGAIDNNLVQIFSDYSFSSPLLVLDNKESLSFEEVDDKIYFCNNSVNGIIYNGVIKSWGIDKTQPNLNLSITTGNLLSGNYQISYTYVNGDGIESGCSESQKINIPNDSSGISFALGNAPDSSIQFARVYCSTQNGKVLFYSGICLPNSTYTISNTSSLSNPLRVFNLDKAPLGHSVNYHNGRLFIAQDNVLWYSEKFQYQHWLLASNYIEFPTRIRAVMPVESGIWVASDKLYFLSGNEPDQYQRITKDIAKAVEGTAIRMNGTYDITPGDAISYYWLLTTNLGIYALMEQGVLVNQTIPNVEFQQADSGNGIFLKSNGMNQYISMLKTNNTPNNSVVGDLVETTIVRNGITIQ
jgi:hypothetical protein